MKDHFHLSHPSLPRTPSFIRGIVHIGSWQGRQAYMHLRRFPFLFLFPLSLCTTNFFSIF